MQMVGVYWKMFVDVKACDYQPLMKFSQLVVCKR